MHERRDGRASRLYDEVAVDRLAFIGTAKGLGLPLPEIRRLLQPRLRLPELVELAEAESQCCPFLDLAVRLGPPVELEARAPRARAGPRARALRRAGVAVIMYALR